MYGFMMYNVSIKTFRQSSEMYFRFSELWSLQGSALMPLKVWTAVVWIRLVARGKAEKISSTVRVVASHWKYGNGVIRLLFKQLDVSEKVSFASFYLPVFWLHSTIIIYFLVNLQF